MEFSMAYVFFAIAGLCIVLISFMVIVKTVNGIGINLLRMEYLLKRELVLVREQERIKVEIMRQQQLDEERRKRMDDDPDGLANIASTVRKDKG